MNSGLGLRKLKSFFPDVKPVTRLDGLNQIIDPYWFAGFVDGKGCFFVGISKKFSF